MRTTIALAAVFVSALVSSEPKITGVLPERIMMSAKPLQISVAGEDLREGLVLVVTTPDNKTRNMSGSDIVERTAKGFRVSVLFDAPGPYELMVINSDGAKSMPFRIDVKRAVDPPVIERIQPEEIRRAQEVQPVTIRGGGFQPGLKATLTDPTGNVKVFDTFDRLDASVAIVRLPFEISGVYGLAVANSTGETSNSITITVR